MLNGGLHQGRIDWKHISEEDFNRVVEVLVTRMYHHPPASEVVVLDGRGGDGGIDIGVYVNDKIDQIFQLKFFPEGFSGGWGKARRPQIKKSFLRAMDHGPREWTLVMPRNPTDGERKHISTLASGLSVRVDVWGQHRLDDELAKFPDIEGSVVHEPLVEVLKQFNMEQAALAGPHDLARRALALNKLADNRSPNWAIDHQVIAGQVTQILRAKHARAAELEPIVLNAAFNFAKEDAELGKKFQRVLGYGARRTLSLPSKVVESFSIDGPDWIKDDGSAGVARLELRVEPLAAKDRIPITLVFLDDQGFTTARHEGLVHQAAQGNVGISFTADFYGVVELDAELPRDPAGTGRLDLSFEFAGHSVANALRGMELAQRLYTGDPMQILLGGLKFAKGRSQGDSPIEFDAGLLGLLDDLHVLESKLNATFMVPATLADRDRLQIRIGRLLLEQKATWLPRGSSLTGTLSGDSLPELEELLSVGGAVVSEVPSFALEVDGSRFDLGRTRFFHPHVVVREGKKALKAVKAGTAAGMEIIMDPSGSQGISVVRLEDRAEGEETPEPVGWDIPNFPEYSE
ncbi:MULTISPECIES: hypothetical protein [unclassified Pseudarthrobacter]|uniref:hypothetical protein n=1 Tax=unclassified Pseudarthrobacter TaxID=2647000 RepID=UPI0030781C8B